LRSSVIVMLSILALGACTTARQTNPQRAATEQLLISTAADHGADALDLAIPRGSRIFVDASNFDGYDNKYAIGAIRDHLLKRGYRLAADKGGADTVVEIRAGALSVDEKTTLVGIPSFDIPVPLSSGAIKTPEIALYKRAELLGVAKLAATGYDAKDGSLIASSDPKLGFSYVRRWVVALLISWTTDDLLPHEDHEAPTELLPELPAAGTP
jgi:hypothetical protein